MSDADAKPPADRARLDRLIAAQQPCIRVATFEEAHVLDLVRDVALERRLDHWVWSFTRGIEHGLLASRDEAVKDTEHPAAALYYLLRKEGSFIAVLLDLLPHAQDPKVMRLLRDLIADCARRGNTLVLIDGAGDAPAAVAAEAVTFQPSLPDAEELRQIVGATLRRLHRQQPVKVSLNRTELRTFVKNLRGLTRRQAERVVCEAVSEDRHFHAEDINHVLAAKRQLFSGAGLLEYVETPVTLDDVGGLRRLKRWLKMRRAATEERAKKFGLPPARGVLMLGVQGAGKSMCAKAIATAWQWPLLRMDPGALYDRYIGESERRLREALRQAEAMAPIVLWIDEIEKGFASAASRSADGGLSQRMFGSLLTWMQEHDEPVFLVATANDIEALPPELLRKGRFDDIFFVDLPDPATRRQIASIHLRKRGRDCAAFDLDALTAASAGYSGAEIEQAIVASLYEAFEADRELCTADVLAALEASPPLSVTMAERIEALRQWADGRCVPAD